MALENNWTSSYMEKEINDWYIMQCKGIETERLREANFPKDKCKRCPDKYGDVCVKTGCYHEQQRKAAELARKVTSEKAEQVLLAGTLPHVRDLECARYYGSQGNTPKADDIHLQECQESGCKKLITAIGYSGAHEQVCLDKKCHERTHNKIAADMNRAEKASNREKWTGVMRDCLQAEGSGHMVTHAEAMMIFHSWMPTGLTEMEQFMNDFGLDLPKGHKRTFEARRRFVLDWADGHDTVHLMNLSFCVRQWTQRWSRYWIDRATQTIYRGKELAADQETWWRGVQSASIDQTCRVCGCTDNDCSGCIERTGKPCSWVEADLCSACASVGEGEGE